MHLHEGGEVNEPFPYGNTAIQEEVDIAVWEGNVAPPLYRPNLDIVVGKGPYKFLVRVVGQQLLCPSQSGGHILAVVPVTQFEGIAGKSVVMISSSTTSPAKANDNLSQGAWRPMIARYLLTKWTTWKT